MRPLIISLETGIASRRAIRSMPFCSDKGLSHGSLALLACGSLQGA
ncbi:MAG: hypothetical protein WA240_10625 [Nitrospirota bacterium]